MEARFQPHPNQGSILSYTEMKAMQGGEWKRI
jgi:hypothetical protein